MKTFLACASWGLLAASAAVAQQPPGGITREMVETALPEEGAPKAVAGPYAVTSEPAFGTTGLKTFRPANLDSFPRHDKLPVVVWGNGGCAIENARYAGFLTTIASHGFLVITTTRPPGAAATPPAPPAGGPAAGPPGPRATAADLTAAVDWADKENSRAGSPLNGKIDTKQVAVMGQSCGGFLSITLGADPRVGTIGVFNSGVQPRNPAAPPGAFPSMEDLRKLHGPVLLINGGDRDFLMASSKATYEAIDKLPAFYGSRHGAGHTATAYHPGGGEWANVATNWVMWQFKGDRKAKAMFVGPKCELCTNSNWDVAAKRLK
jgi:dienelactone hydrolase